MGAIFLILGIALAGAAGVVAINYFLAPRRELVFRALTESSYAGQTYGAPSLTAQSPLGVGSGFTSRASESSSSENYQRLKFDPSGEELERVKALAKKRSSKKEKQTLEERFFQAGMFSEPQKKKFYRMTVVFPICLGVFGLFAGLKIGAAFALIGSCFGIAIGMQLPYSILDRRIRRRSDEIMYYLPLVIEQIVIGVSSSLDIGPCIQRVVQMADERDSHNAVTELLRHCQHMVRSGVSLEEALQEIGKLSGHTELKHSFMALSQVVKHGGEITRQLQELADAVSGQRETRIEGKIKKLELEATGPVGLVFVGFLMLLLIGIGVQVMKAFPS